MSQKADYHLKIAKNHLDRVLAAWDEPTDWTDLTTYGLYCIEAIIHAAAVTVGIPTVKTHWGKVEIAKKLHRKYGITDVWDLMSDLNAGRKAHAYGDTEFDESELDPKQIANSIEQFYAEVTSFARSKSRRR